MASHAVEIENPKAGEITEAVYEHPFIVRLCHWVNSISLFVLVGSGLQIFLAFPSFGAKIPQKDLIHWPKAFAIGGWLGGALQWHLTFVWIYIASVWPMVRHYFLFGPKPLPKEAYNPLQKHAYTSAIVLGVLSVLTGLAI